MTDEETEEVSELDAQLALIAAEATKPPKGGQQISCACRDSGRTPVVVYDDTPDPVICGSCGAIMRCAHDWVDRRNHERHGGVPVLHTWRECSRCHTTKDDAHTEIPDDDETT